MSKEKNNKNDLYLEKKEEKDSEERASKKLEKRIVSFDVYFQGLMKKDSKVAAHHKAPMRKFAELKGLTEATEDDFNEVFKAY